MAGKKKKPAANPARGFATTSIASKPKVQETSDSAPSSVADTATPASTKRPSTPAQTRAQQTKPQDATPTHQTRSEEKELHELSPEELEKRLEQAELQSIVDKYSAKTLRDATRHVQKLQTDCRLIRSSALPVSARSLLNEQLVDEILELGKHDFQTGRIHSVNEVERRPIKEDDAIVRLWTLRRALESLGFEASAITSAMKYILRFPPAFDTEALVWGLNETLDWLVLNSCAKDLPVYEASSGKPRRADALESLSEISDDLPDVDPKANGGQKRNIGTRADASTNPELPEVEDDIVVSDLEDDLEPNELLDAWISTRARLYGIKPELVDPPNSKGRKQVALAPSSKLDTPGIRKLQQKLTTIESDILFDRQEAEQKWVLRRNLIAQDLADKRRNQMKDLEQDKSEVIVGTPTVHGSDSPQQLPSENVDLSDQDEIGGLFGEAMEQAEAEAAEHSEKIIADTKDVNLRLFETSKGKGLTPRRLLEETCKAR